MSIRKFPIQTSPHSCAEFLELSHNDMRANEHLMRCELTNIYNQIQSQPTKCYVFAEQDIAKVFVRIVARIKIQNAEKTCTESVRLHVSLDNLRTISHNFCCFMQYIPLCIVLS
jgi:hypothetical protein